VEGNTMTTIRHILSIIRRDKKAAGHGAYGTAWLTDESRDALSSASLMVRHQQSAGEGILLGCFLVGSDGHPDTIGRKSIDV